MPASGAQTADEARALLTEEQPVAQRARQWTSKGAALVGVVVAASMAGAGLAYLGVASFGIGRGLRGQAIPALPFRAMGQQATGAPPSAPKPALPASVAVDVGTPAGLITQLATGGWVNCTGIEERALGFLRLKRLVPQATVACPKCGAGFSSPCCYSWMQSGLAVPCNQINTSAPATLNVTLSLEEGISPGLARFIRALPKLTAPQRAQLIHILQVDYGVYQLSQMGSIYPVEVVDKMKLESKAVKHVLLAMLFNEFGAQDSTQGEGPPVAPNSGGQMGLRQLIAQQGLLRGVSVSPKAVHTNLGQVVTYTAEVAAMSDDGLSQEVLLQPDVETKELVIETISAEKSASMNAMMSTMGASGMSAQAKSNSLSASGGYGGASGGASSSSSSSSSSGSSSSSSQTFSDISSQTSTQLFMDKYFIQPQAFIALGQSMLQPTQFFSEAVMLLSSKDSGYTVKDLFGEFGTHVCLGAELGAWWKVSASLVVKKSSSVVGMSSVCSAAIDSATSRARSSSVSGGYGNDTAGFSHSHSSSASSQSSSLGGFGGGSSKGKMGANLQVAQEWKGGVSHENLSAWLESIQPGHNSNWKVVNRRISDCIGIWQFVRDGVTRHAICMEYLTAYLTEMNIDNWTTDPSPAQVQAGNQLTYACSCTQKSLSFSNSTPGSASGNNAISCVPSAPSAPMYCDTSYYWCNNPNTVLVSNANDAKSALCSLNFNQQWTTTTTTTRTTTATPSQVTTSISEICLGAADIKTVTERVEQMVAKTVQAKHQAKISSCDSTLGYHWSGSGTTGTCKQNQCTCAGKPGAVGAACPVDGQEVCTPAQQQTCNSGACAKPGYWYNGTQSKCVSSTCAPTEPDLSTCCAPISQGNNFLANIAVDNGGTCQVVLTVTGPDPGQSITYTSQSSTVDFKNNVMHQLTVSSPTVKGFTPTKLCMTLDSCTLTVNTNNLPSGITLYNGGISATPGSGNEVGCTFGSWQEFKGNTRTQCSAVSPCR